MRVLKAGGAAIAIAAVAALGAAGCGLRPYQSGASASPARPSAAGGGKPAAAAVPAVRATFTAAISAVAAFGSPPPAYQVSVQSAIRSRRPVPRYSAAMLADMRSSQLAAIRQYFGPPQAAAERAALARALGSAGDPRTINLGSGTSTVSFRYVRVRASLATVSALVTQWGKSAARRPAPGGWLTDAVTHVLHYTATLRQAADGSWRVTALSAR